MHIPVTFSVLTQVLTKAENQINCIRPALATRSGANCISWCMVGDENKAGWNFKNRAFFDNGQTTNGAMTSWMVPFDPAHQRRLETT